MAAPFAAYVMDMRSGEMLYEKNADTPLHPASLTKMMTLYITFQAIEHGEFSLDSIVTVTKHAASQPPSRLGLRPGQKIAVRYLIRAAAIKSANDAAAALGDYIGGSEAGFAVRMNRTAKQMGMKNTHFVNENGLTRKGHLSSAHDMAILGRHLFFDFPQYYNIFSRRSADAKVATVYSTNRRFLNAYEGADGIKTGYTAASGFNLCASAKRGNKRIIATVFGGTSTANRNAKMADLLDLGFRKAPENARTLPPTPPQYIPPSSSPALIAQNLAPKTSLRPDDRPDLPQADGDAIALALAKAVQNDQVDDSVTDTPEDVAENDASPADTTVVADAGQVGIGADITASPRPLPSPRAIQVAEVKKAQPAEVTGATPLAQAAKSDAEAATPSDIQLASYDPEGTSDAAAPSGPKFVQSTQPQPETEELAKARAMDLSERSPGAAAQAITNKPEATPQAKSDMILAALTPEAPTPAAKPRVVSRVSTSGGRNWGVSLGLFGSQFAAERHLLTTALMDSDTLGSALRKVATRTTGYEANFVGMTENGAQLACARLTARAMDCKVIGP
ncbi:D-Ala-D-Ala carboxypeptidase [Thioclava dalianensis]|uniref:D-Ala-D-Ala carboxypeptidase n=1 Tax=Thioclava dalianensis TaxID=1185766 RepID=A0A074TJD5_9RHOB|nr:D-alanyl-D-alanine carboxypeptidase family protein [Thioclava dalianensis]KEP70240.1 D-Ala-D-Ala carboxypeptidase [Thioclava dalianensis]SFM82661.1 D-alanyl-D-alanine carboxypeptidase [Thioclava dalianensis]